MKRFLTAVAAAATVATLIATPAAHAAPQVPVLVISGTVSNTWSVAPLTKHLQSQGRNVSSMSLSLYGLDRTVNSAALVDAKIQEVLRQTGASKLDVVGWSQGAHISRYWAQQGDNASKINTLVLLGSPTYEWSWSTTANNLGLCWMTGQNCQDQAAGSEILTGMNSGPDMPEGPKVFNIWTMNDLIVTPAGTVSVLQDGNTGEQFSIQDVCPHRPVGHFGLVNDAASHRIVEAALQGRRADSSACVGWPFVL